MQKAQPEIFFSYAWGGEKEEYAIALYDALKANCHKVVMDRHDVQYRESFTQFMLRIGRGAIIVLVVSDKYLRSPFCMFELLEIYRKSNSELGEMAAKVIPVVMGDANIYDDAGILQYTKYWRQKTKDLSKGMTDEMDLVDTVDFGTKLKRYNEIANNITHFALWLQDIRVDKPEKLAENGFAIIKQAIKERKKLLTQQAPDGLPHHLTAPPFLSEVFLGREDDLEKVRQMLFGGDNLLLLVNGMGGMGKTSLAAHYYHNYTNEYAHLAWVLSEKSIVNALLLLAVPLGIRFDDQLNETQRLEILIQVMANLPKPCLLVIDNANELDDLEAHYNALRRCPNFHLLLTTRIDKFEKAPVCKIGALPYEKALQLFSEYYPGHPAADNALFEEVYNSVGGNTLVLELLAKNLAILNEVDTQYSLAQLVNDLKEGLLAIAQTRPVGLQYHGLLKGDPLDIIAAMYDISELAPPEKRLLSVMAVLPAENIPFAMLQTLLPATQQLTDTMALLAKKGWLEHNKTEAAFKISPIIQEITRAKNADLLGDCEELIERLTFLLEYQPGVGHFANISYQDAPILARYSEIVLGHFTLNNEVFVILLERLGRCHQTLGNLPKALQFYEDETVLFKQLFDQYPDNVDFKNGLAIAYSKLGQTHASMGNLPKALQFYELDADLSKQLFDQYPDNVAFKNGLANSYGQLGGIYASMGNLQEALRFYVDTKELFKELHDAYPDNVAFKNGLAISYEMLGQTHADMGNLNKALQFYEDQSRLAKQLFDDYPDNVAFKNGLAVSYSKLGQTHASMGNLNKALQFYEDQTVLFKQLFDDYPDNVAFKNGLAISYEKLGQTHASMGNLNKALQFYEDQSRLTKQLFDDYPDNVTFKNGLAISYAKLGEFYKNDNAFKARQYFEQAKKLWIELVETAPQHAEFNKYLSMVQQDLADLEGK